MCMLRILSITASSFTLAISITAIAILSLYEWNQYKKNKQNHNCHRPPYWKTILEIAVTLITSAGFSISLLIFSVLYNEKLIEVFLVLFGRFLLLKHAEFLWGCIGIQQTVRSIATDDHLDNSFKFSLSAVLPYLRRIIACTSVCFLVSTVFIAQELFRNQNRRLMLRLSLMSFAGEYLGLSSTYAYLIWCFRYPDANVFRHYQMSLSIVSSLLGCFSATMLSSLAPVYRISWVLVLWIQFGIAALWFVRGIVIGIHGLLTQRREQRARILNDAMEFRERRLLRIQGFAGLGDDW